MQIFRANALLGNRLLRRSTITSPAPGLLMEANNRDSIITNESEHLLASPMNPEPMMPFMGQKKSVQILTPPIKTQNHDEVFIRNFSTSSSRQGVNVC